MLYVFTVRPGIPIISLFNSQTYPQNLWVSFNKKSEVSYLKTMKDIELWGNK